MLGICMNKRMGHLKGGNGFTIVELLIVIVVIGILAAITIVAFNGVQQRARDADRKSDINTLVKAMSMWSIQEGKTPLQTNAGYNNTGEGWVYAAGYTANIETVLSNAGLLSGTVRDPQTPVGNGSYMFYRCSATKPTIYAFFAGLESPSAADGADFARWQAEGCGATPTSATYKMNYAKIFMAAS